MQYFYGIEIFLWHFHIMLKLLFFFPYRFAAVHLKATHLACGTGFSVANDKFDKFYISHNRLICCYFQTIATGFYPGPTAFSIDGIRLACIFSRSRPKDKTNSSNIIILNPIANPPSGFETNQRKEIER